MRLNCFWTDEFTADVAMWWISLFLFFKLTHAYACPSPHEQYTIHSQAAADNISHCATIQGDVQVSSNDSIQLRGVRSIAGGLSFAGAALDATATFTAPDLEYVGGVLAIAAGGLREVALNRTTIVGGLYIDSPALHALNVPSGLAAWSRSTYYADDAGTDAWLAGFMAAIYVAASSVAELPELRFDTAAAVQVSDNAQLSRLDLGLQTVTTNLTVAGNGNGNFSLSLPRLKNSSGPVLIDGCSHLSLPALEHIENSFHITNGSTAALDFDSLKSIGRPATQYAANQGDALAISQSTLSTLRFPVLSEAAEIELDQVSNLTTTNVFFPTLDSLRLLSAELVNDTSCDALRRYVCNGSIGSLDCSNATYVAADCTSASDDAIIIPAVTIAAVLFLAVAIVLYRRRHGAPRAAAAAPSEPAPDACHRPGTDDDDIELPKYSADSSPPLYVPAAGSYPAAERLVASWSERIMSSRARHGGLGTVSENMDEVPAKSTFDVSTTER